MSLSVAEAEFRCEQWAGWKYSITTVAIGSSCWVLYLRRLPEMLINSYLTMRAAQGIPEHEEDDSSNAFHEQDIEGL